MYCKKTELISNIRYSLLHNELDDDLYEDITSNIQKLRGLYRVSSSSFTRNDISFLKSISKIDDSLCEVIKYKEYTDKLYIAKNYKKELDTHIVNIMEIQEHLSINTILKIKSVSNLINSMTDILNKHTNTLP